MPAPFRIGYLDCMAGKLPQSFATLEEKGYRSELAPKVWMDADKTKLESCLRDFMVAALVRGEQQHRDQALRIREWIIERKAAILEERARQKAEREKREREQREKEEQERVKSLLRQADDLQKATTIRAYVKEIQERISDTSLDPLRIEEWSKWALSVADRLDPALHLEAVLKNQSR